MRNTDPQIPNFPDHILDLFDAWYNFHVWDSIKESHPNSLRIMHSPSRNEHPDLIVADDMLHQSQNYVLNIFDGLIHDAVKRFLRNEDGTVDAWLFARAMDDLPRQSKARKHYA